ncbi:sensor histidine kinase [Coprobacillus sp. AF13-15]|jgi:signal transduction histidine kinase|uniref:Heme sensor protein HssS n=1 Tax=Faecalibacillus intestinalis TaxID=1982626 RepID=A0AAW4VF35_9FIRM|nr:HAMP domain-containing sensor histidine kinase [Faecalibacillus intestinalis]RGF61143.1 sensor histidine kinase [Coprobacillus sp. AF36-10BH]RGG33111.1 sensor histidine kinase [Coprobacillus sp. AF24-1LB]RHO35870.1 sensor histidine kinase [Coprobacillus sp. AM17-34]RHP55777.1 sensor histidine kinase [Coprobacillus sp. AF31-1BH]RHP78565.1 sensor histidine kinase [Coprobacillus sp. OF03-2AA]RHS09524.1 sensor histidine kinase [Coprobacillus sp. AF13-4LB]RHS16149.1 sensor histidine kinase [Co
MKSIYSKLIFGFFITIVASFSVAGFVSLRLNDQQIESTVEEDLITTNDYVSKVISNINIENRDDIIDLYAKSSEMAITCYSSSEGYVAYGNKKYNPTPEQIMAMFKSTNNELSFKHHNEVLAYGTKNMINGQEYYIYVQKDTSGQKSAIANSAILILGCVFLTGSIVFLVIADIIVKPLTRLTNAIKELSNGNYNVRVDNVGQDEISKLNQGFNQMARQLAKQDETRQKFISDISHEFQTPLTSIQGFANILKEEDLPKEQRVKYANIILYNSKRLSSLAKNMLQLTLLDREEIELELTNYSLVEQMNRVISTQENQAMEKNIEIVFEMPKKEIFIEGDEQRLEQVWTNIISNAIKYTNEGGLITITMKKNSKDIEVSIEDTGIGMSKEVVSHIFERFYREDKARNVEGNGLGLAIVKSIVDLHHGKIDILSQVDVGTNFIVRLPIEKQKLIERLKR